MTGTCSKPKVASLVWSLPGLLHQAQGSVVKQLGYPHEFFSFDEPIPSDAKIVLVQGPYGPLVPLVRQLKGSPSGHRPILAYWFQQSFYRAGPPALRDRLGTLFSDLYAAYPNQALTAAVLHRRLFRLARTRGRRLGFVGDILWLDRHGLLDVLVLSSDVYARHLGRIGIDPLLMPRGYHDSYGQLLSLERDIAVVWMGKTRTRRRKRHVYWLRDELKRRGLAMQIHDGDERPFIFGHERTEILNRACFVLNVLTQPADELSIRYYIAAANGAVVISEPGQNRYPFLPGRHFVECAVRDMPDAIERYLENRSEWQAMADEMHRLMTSEVTLENSLEAILGRAGQICEDRCALPPTTTGE